MKIYLPLASRKVTTLLLIIVFLIVACSLSACRKNPLEVLKSDELEPDMDKQFWINEQHEETREWNQAVIFCRGHTEKPNCEPVLELFMMSD